MRIQNKSLSFKSNMDLKFKKFKMRMPKRYSNSNKFKMIYKYRSTKFKMLKTNVMFRLKD